MAWVVPSGRNLMRNPRPASLAHITGTQVVLVYDRSFSGETSARATFDGLPGAYVRWDSNAPGDWPADVPAGSELIGRVRLYSAGGGDVDLVALTIRYTDGTIESASGPAALDPDALWTTVTLGPITADPLKTIDFVYVYAAHESSEKVVYLGGADVRVGAEIDGFIVGGGNAHMTWEGTPEDSPSIRAGYQVDAVKLTGGQYKFTTTYYLVDRRNRILDDITEFVDACSITQDLLSDTVKGTAQLTLNSRGVVDAWTDQWIRPHLMVEKPDGSIEGGTGLDGALGLYSVEPSSERYDVTSNSFVFNGYDPLWLLQQQALVAGPGDREVGAVLLRGQDYRAKLIALFAEVGFTEANGLLYLPPVPPGMSAVASRNYGAELGRPYLEFITFVIDGQAWRRPWVTLQGQATAEPRKDLATQEPDLYFASGDGSDVRWPFEADPELDRVANRVIVFSKRSGDVAAIKVVLAITDKAHPLHPENLGHLDPDTGQVRPRYIDAPRIDVTNVASLAHAQAIAVDELSKRSMLPYVVRMRTRAMIAPLNSVYQLNITDYNGDPIDHGQGKYWCTGWQLDLQQPWEMVHNLRRVIPVIELPEEEVPNNTGGGPPGETPEQRRERERRERQRRERERARDKKKRARDRRRSRRGG